MKQSKKIAQTAKIPAQQAIRPINQGLKPQCSTDGLTFGP
ncbi:hypothetical protein PSP6_440169 [Paraburkholderia tropica]|nr:hypothetical protein PSP6_440169 [Paraburkholderia tropica]